MCEEQFDGERIDEIGFHGLRLIQKPEDFCYGVDAVILADFAAKRMGQAGRVMDLGMGTGILPVLLSHKTGAAELYGLEVQADAYERACRNAKLNQLSHRMKPLLGDVADIETMGELHGTFDAVVSNPPYMTGNCGLTNHSKAKTIARHETTADLRGFIQGASKLLKDKGTFFLVHRPSRLVDICALCREYKLEPKELRFVSPDKESKPNIILVHCVKNGGVELRLCPPLYVYEKDGDYTEEISRIYER